MTASPASARSHQSGFTLTELAVVFTIVALLLASAMYTLSAQTENRNIADTQRRLEDARELIIGFAIANGRLPCPASTTSSGDESPSGGGVCTDAYAGYLPAKAIGFTPIDSGGYGLDVWGNRIRYAVSVNSNDAAATNPDNLFTTSSGMKNNFNPTATTTLAPQDLLICTLYDTGTGSITTAAPSCGTSPNGIGATNQNTVVAVVWSQGRNYSSVSFSGVSGQAGADEAMNNKVRLPSANANHGVFVSHAPRPFSETNAFDDQIVWIPIGLLYAKMTAAGVLP
jgi:prepilin-type N-terminal cleavage/methylation domain-containing protein